MGHIDLKLLIPPIPLDTTYVSVSADGVKVPSGKCKRYSEKDRVRKQHLLGEFLSLDSRLQRIDIVFSLLLGQVITFFSFSCFQNAFLFSSIKKLKNPNWTCPISTRNLPL